MEVTGVNGDGSPVTFLQPTGLEGSRRVARAGPYIIPVRDSIQAGAECGLEV